MADTCYDRNCKQTTNNDGGALRKCSRCQKASYCSLECQKKHWPTHKGLCPGSRKTLPRPELSFRVLLPDESGPSYGKIIDTFRLRVEDDYVHGRHNHSIYGESDPRPAFEDFLNRCEAAGNGFMPMWWDGEKREKCLEMALNSSGNFCIRHAVEKSDIQEFYGDNMMPMSLRMVAENVYGGGYGMGQNPMPKGYQCLC